MTTVTSTRNAAVKAARQLGRRQGRSDSDGFLVEGLGVLREARPWLRRLFVGPGLDPDAARFVDDAASHGVEVITVSGHVLASLSRTVTPQGLVGVAELPEPSVAPLLANASIAVLLCEINDPGNLGALLRSADAAGADVVITTPGSASVRNDKAVRASAGSLFHVPVAQRIPFDEAVAGCRARGLQVVAADAGGSTIYTDVDFSRPTCVVFGSEAHGIGGERLAACDAVAAVPMRGRAESLNLAATATLFLFEAARQQVRGGDS